MLKKLFQTVILCQILFLELGAQCHYKLFMYDSYGDGWNGGAIEVYEGESFPRWRDNLLVASLRFGRLHRLQLEEGRVLHDEILFEWGRLRDIETGPDGLIYLALEKPGRIVRLVPAN